ncbi:MAG TPA: hypothetical protein VFH26_04340, partial [Gemmatimonadales bacterium]|nr:hypothetical protein [Gemmatimonadales bacterium]
MKRAVLPVVTIGLFAMVVADRISHALGTDRDMPPVQGPSDTRSATVELSGPTGARSEPERVPSATSPSSGTPTLDR